MKGVSAAAEAPGCDGGKCVRVQAGSEAKPPPLRCGGSALMVEVVSAMETGFLTRPETIYSPSSRSCLNETIYFGIFVLN